MATATSTPDRTDREPVARLVGEVLIGDDQSARWVPGERLHHLFEQRCDSLRAEGAVEHLAVARDGLAVTFDELDARANRTARFLRERGVGPGHRVGLLLDDALAGYVAVLAVLKAGAAYVPLDPAFPPDRLSYIIDDAGVGEVLSTAHLREQLSTAETEVVCLDEAAADIAARDPSRLGAAELDDPVDELCYIIYTSGTTGRPKGVPIEHASICNFVRVAGDVYGIGPDDRVYQGMTIAFDFSVEEIWVPLVAGATLVPRPGGNLVGDELVEFLRAERVSALCCVPTLLATLPNDLPDLRFLLVSGEACPADLVAGWWRPDRRFLNVYGPTETTVTATWTTLHPDRPVTIGVPLPTYAVVILDETDQHPLPPGELGEIGIAGIGLSPGYLHRDELTEKAFIPDPIGIADNPSGRIYRSGDLGRITADGHVECLGRIDTQVKIRGYRIELTEIESVLRGLPGVGEAVVDSHEPDPGRVELVAYYTARPDERPVAAEDLHAGLRERLPRYMVPAYYDRLDRIPVLPSDKADRNALPPPSGPRLTGHGEHVEPDGEVERGLAAAVAEVLDMDRVSVESHFFDDLGMSSLSLAHLRTRLREHPATPPVSARHAYDNPTVRSLAAAIGSTKPRVQRTGARPVHVAGTAAHVACGVVQAVLYLVGAGILALVLVSSYYWIARAPGPVDGYLRVVAAGGLLLLADTLIPVAAKWLLIGRWKPGSIRLWSAGYLRFWVVRQLLRASPMTLLAGSPLYPLYLRALGARVGRGAVVFTRFLPVCTDLVDIGDGAVIRRDALLLGFRAESGLIHFGRVDIGRDALVGEASVLDIDTALGEGAQLGHASALATGQRVPPGARYGGAPAQETTTDFADVEARPCSRRRRATYATFQLMMTALVTVPLIAAVPLLALPAGYAAMAGVVGPAADEPADPAFPLVHLPIAAGFLAAGLLVQLAVAVAAPRLLDPLVPADETHPLYGVRYAAHRLLGRLSNSAMFNELLGDSSYVVGYQRVIGYDLVPVQQTGSNFGLATGHDSPRHVRVGTGTLVSDGLSLINARYSSSSFTMSRTVVGARCFLGNNVAYPARSTVADNCLLATKVMVPIDGPPRTGVGLLGSPAFEIPRSTRRDPELDRYSTVPEFPARLARKNRANLLSIGAYLLQRLLLFYGLLLLFFAASGLAQRIGELAYGLGIIALVIFGTLLSAAFERSGVGRRLSPQYCSIYQPYYWRHERMWKLSRISSLPMFSGTAFKPVLWRLLGVRMGRRVFDDGAIIPEKTLVAVGDDVTVNAGVVIQCHSLEDATFRSDRTRIGTGATLGPNSFVHYGVDVGERVVLDADAFLMKGEAPPPDTRWQGNPAVEVDETETT